jgi:hypothetical protein
MGNHADNFANVRFWRNGAVQATKKGVTGGQFASPQRFSIVRSSILLAHDPEKHVLDLIGDGHRFSDKIMRKQ